MPKASWLGMPMMFSGFPIGQVSGMTLTRPGSVRIEVRIKVKDARWLRTSSAFILERQLLGGAKIRALSREECTIQRCRPMPSACWSQPTRRKDIPHVIARANSILQNIDEIIRPDSSFNQTLANLKSVTERMAGEYGMHRAA